MDTPSDQERWNARYAADDGYIMGPKPKPFVGWLLAQSWFPKAGHALDLAAGEGQTAVALAQHGLSVEAWDVSDVGLLKAEQLAADADVSDRLSPRRVDLTAIETSGSLPDPTRAFDVVTVLHYKQPSLAPLITRLLKPGGIVAIEIAGVQNLTRHRSPSRRFLVEDAEVEGWFPEFTRLHRCAKWRSQGSAERYLVRYVGRRV